MTNAEAWFSIALRPRKPEGSLGQTAQDVHLDSHTAPELSRMGELLKKNLFIRVMLPVDQNVVATSYC